MSSVCGVPGVVTTRARILGGTPRPNAGVRGVAGSGKDGGEVVMVGEVLLAVVLGRGDGGVGKALVVDVEKNASVFELDTGVAFSALFRTGVEFEPAAEPLDSRLDAIGVPVALLRPWNSAHESLGAGDTGRNMLTPRRKSSNSDSCSLIGDDDMKLARVSMGDGISSRLLSDESLRWDGNGRCMPDAGALPFRSPPPTYRLRSDQVGSIPPFELNAESDSRVSVEPMSRLNVS